MLDLEHQIQIWRAEMLKATGSEEIVAELESHLRESLDIRLKKGLDPVKAWEETQAELGSPQHLAPQFALNTKPLPWLPSRIFSGLWLLGMIIGALWFLPLFATPKIEQQAQDQGMGWTLTTLLRLHVLTLIAGYWTLFATAGFACWFLIARQAQQFSPGQIVSIGRLFQRGSLITCCLLGTGTILGMIWSHQAWGILWNSSTKEYACLVITLTTFGVFLFARVIQSKPNHVPTAMVFNLIVGLWCFLGPIMNSSDLHAYGYSGRLIPLTMASLILAFIACLGFLPPRSFSLVARKQPKPLK